MTPDQQIANLTGYVSTVLFDMGCTDLAEATTLARDFAVAVQPKLQARSIAEAMRNGDVPLPQQQESGQEVLTWA